jgi:hypothetical protein
MKYLLERGIDDISNILQVYLTSAPFEKKWELDCLVLVVELTTYQEESIFHYYELSAKETTNCNCYNMWKEANDKVIHFYFTWFVFNCDFYNFIMLKNN